MFQRYFDEGLAQCSFLIGCERTGEALVVDPRRDVGVYVEAAARRNLRIAYTIETHIHADFVSGSRELAALGATTIAGPGSGLAVPYREARDGEVLEIGGLRCRFLHTPGHTPEHISIVVEQPDEPARIFTGDTLFVGAVGRPDLLGEEQTRQLAGQLYDSLYLRLMTLDDGLEVHPGHGAGSLCGAGIGTEPRSTIGQERRFNPMLRHTSKDAFVAAVLADLPETPSYFPRMKRVNHDGPPVLGLARGLPDLAALTPHEAASAARDGAWIVDLRAVDEFAAGHPAGAINIAFGAKVGYWAGWIVPGDARIVLLASSDTHVRAAQPQLLRVGLDRIDGLVAGGFDAWARGGLPVQSMPAIEVAELRTRLARRDPLTLLDVRTRKEFGSDHLEGAVNVPVGDLPASDVPHAAGPILTMCEAGFRSSLAASLLQRRGVREVVNVTGGMNAYRQETGGRRQETG
jgi:hydroxyacylglutathione hydrolase